MAILSEQNSGNSEWVPLEKTLIRSALRFAAVAVVLLDGLPIPASAEMRLGTTLTVGLGGDPDVAIDSRGRLHAAYARDGRVYYRLVADNVIGDEIVAGAGIDPLSGEDPQIAVDSKNRPHIVFANGKYAYWEDKVFTEPIQPVIGLRSKPRIAADFAGRAHITVQHGAEPREIRRVVLQQGAALGPVFRAGDGNNGGVAVHSRGTTHLTWRAGRTTFYNTYHPRQGGSRPVPVNQDSSDSSWITVDSRDDSVRIVNTKAGGGGLLSISKEWRMGTDPVIRC